MVFSGRTCSLQPSIAPSDTLAGRSADAAARELLILVYFKPVLAAQCSYSQHTGITREAVGGLRVTEGELGTAEIGPTIEMCYP